MVHGHIKLFLVLLSEGQDKLNYDHKIRKVNIKSKNFQSVDMQDFQKNCQSSIFKTNYEISYVFDIKGCKLENLKTVQNNDILLLKRLPQFNLEDGEINQIVKKVDRLKMKQDPKEETDFQIEPKVNLSKKVIFGRLGKLAP